jgi:hypothetical protein
MPCTVLPHSLTLPPTPSRCPPGPKSPGPACQSPSPVSLAPHRRPLLAACARHAHEACTAHHYRSSPEPPRPCRADPCLQTRGPVLHFFPPRGAEPQELHPFSFPPRSPPPTATRAASHPHWRLSHRGPRRISDRHHCRPPQLGETHLSSTISLFGAALTSLVLPRSSRS